MTSPAEFAQAVYQLPSKAFGTPALVNPGQEPGQVAIEVGPDSDGLGRGGSAVLMRSLEELEEARPGYALADQMYDGEVEEQFVSEQIAQLLARSGINNVEDLNYAKVPVDTIAEKLQIRTITASAGEDVVEDAAASLEHLGNTTPLSELGNEPAPRLGIEEGEPLEPGKIQRRRAAAAAQKKLEQLRRRNQMDAEEPELMLKASKYGEAYLFVWPVVEAPEDDEDAYEGAAPLDPDERGTVVGVDMFVNSPYTVRMFYDTENPLKATHVLKTWQWLDEQNDTERQRATLYFRDRIERWVLKLNGDPNKAEDWQRYIDEDGDEWPIRNPYDRLPFFHLRNGRTYGKPEHKSAYGPQRLINKLVTTHGSTIDFQGFPQRYFLVDPKMDDVMMNLLDPDNPQDEGDDPEGDGYSQLRADPSAVWKLRASQVGQFAAADPAVFMGPLDRYIKSISELCGIPLSRFVGYGTPPSGESRKIESEPLYEKCGARQKTYGATLADAYEFALQLWGEPEDITVTIKWKPMQVASGLDDWNIIGAKIDRGVPVKQALTEAGYSEDEVEVWLTDQTGADLVRRVALLNSIGTSVQALAAGVAVGMVSPEQAGEIVAKIIGAIGEELPELEQPVELHPQMAAMASQLQQTQRNQQMAEHNASAPGKLEFDPQGNPIPPQPQRPLPDMPPPPAPVIVGGRK